jgi:membrane protein implicated in regulation of membrane protease activity
MTGLLEGPWGRFLVWGLLVISLSAAALRLANIHPQAATIAFLILGAASYVLNLARLQRAKRLRRERTPGG